MANNNKPQVTKKDGLVNESGVVIQNITIRPVQRTQIDIQNWRDAHKMAEGYNSTRIALYDLYADVLVDGFLKYGLIGKRILGVTKNKLKYIINDKEVEEANEFLNKQVFRKLRKEIQWAKAWGIAVIELMEKNGELAFFSVPKKHIRPEEGIILLDQHGTEGVEYRKLKTVFEVGEWDDLGYLLEVAPFAIYKRGDIADWANFAQIFGMPFREARYDGFNEQVRIQLERSLEQAASAAYAVLPKEAEMKFHEASGTAGSNELYNALRKAMNEEMSVTVLGSTETTVSSQSSGYAQAETHRKTVNDIGQDDKEDELSILNDKVLEILVLLGFLPKGGKFIYDEPVDLETATKKVSIGNQLRAAGTPVGDDYFYEVSGVPKPADYQEQKDSQTAPDDDEEEDDDPEPPAKGSKDKNSKQAKKKLSLLKDIKNSLTGFFD